MKKTTLLIALSTISLFSQAFALTNECQKIENPYLPIYDSKETRQEIFTNNGQYILQILKQNSIDSIDETRLNLLLTCMRDSTKLGDPVSAVAFSNMLLQLEKQEALKEAYLTRIIANSHQQYDVMTDLKRLFRRVGPDDQVLEMAFKDKNDADFIEIFSTESHLAVSDVEDLQMAFKDNWDNMPALAAYLLNNSKKDSITEMLGIITLQEHSINNFKTHENNLEDHLIIADYLMDHLEYRPSYEFSKSLYETTLSQGSDSQKSHAKKQLETLDAFFTQKHQ